MYFVGPLNMDRQAKQAKSVMGTVLPLDDYEFDALDIMAAREDLPISFERLYLEVWKARDCHASQEKAQVQLEYLIEQVRIAGQGFMWIERGTELEYTFHTWWAHNRKLQLRPFTDNG